MISTLARTSTGPRVAALLGAAGLLLAGCGGDASSGTTTAARVEGSPPAAAPPSPAPSSPATGGGTSSAGAVSEISVTVAGGEVQGPGARVEVPLGSTVRLTVTSDQADEAHVHGYDRAVDLQPGAPATLEFPADIPGVFEVELHESGLPLTALQVQ